MTVTRYGAYTFPEGSTFPVINRRAELNEAREIFQQIDEWTVRAQILGDGEDELSTKIAAFEAAMAIQKQTLGIYESDDDPTPHIIYNCDVISGPAYSDNTGPEYAVLRTAEVSFRSITDLSPSSGYTAYQESVRFTGGGPTKIVVPVIKGPARVHQVIEQTPYRATQSGSATSTDGSYPNPPGPLFPGAQTIPVDVTTTPITSGGTIYRETQWRYEFESPNPLIAKPNEWLF